MQLYNFKKITVEPDKPAIPGQLFQSYFISFVGNMHNLPGMPPALYTQCEPEFSVCSSIY